LRNVHYILKDKKLYLSLLEGKIYKSFLFSY